MVTSNDSPSNGIVHPIPLYLFKGGMISRLLTSSWTPYQARTSRSKPVASKPIRIITYNIWFDAVLKEQRTNDLFRILREEDPDVCCLQEVTPNVEHMIRSNAFARSKWVLTGLADQQKRLGSHYGTMIILKRALLKDGGRANAFIVDFKETQTGRCLLMLELYTPLSIHPILIGTVHMDYQVPIQAGQFSTCLEHLRSSPTSSSITAKASVLCGDTNLFTYDEVKPMLEGGYVDAWLATHPPTPSSTDGEALAPLDLLLIDPTYGHFGVQVTGQKKKDKESPRRLDLMLCRDSIVNDCRLVGTEPLTKHALKGTGADQDDDLKIFPSDHVGVCVDLTID